MPKLSDIVSIDYEGQTWLDRLVKVGSIAPQGECKYCDDVIRKQDTDFYPSHRIRQGCQSGKRPHCTCSTCF